MLTVGFQPHRFSKPESFAKTFLKEDFAIRSAVAWMVVQIAVQGVCPEEAREGREASIRAFFFQANRSSIGPV